MVDFNGWDMPVQYQGILAEHQAVRQGCGIFDVSHMGRVTVTGQGATAFVERLYTNDFASLRPGRARYTLLCNEEGTILDDQVLFRRGEEDWLIVPNAGTFEKTLGHFRANRAAFPNITVSPLREDTAMVAVQGPTARETVAGMAEGIDVWAIGRFGHAEGKVGGVKATISRTGYTGEDGFELIVPAEKAEGLWEGFVTAGATPCGLGARDTLRLEAGLPLYGNDIDETTNPIEAGLERFVKLHKDFIGAHALRTVAESGPTRRLAGFKVDGRGIPRSHQDILHDGETVGQVTSGTFSPTLQIGIGMGYLPPNYEQGTPIVIDIRGKNADAHVVPLPFYKPQKPQ
jgi:aminomethyltransferase